MQLTRSYYHMVRSFLNSLDFLITGNHEIKTKTSRSDYNLGGASKFG